MGVVGATFIIIMGIMFGSCRPYPRMWTFYTDEGCKLHDIRSLHFVIIFSKFAQQSTFY